MVELDDYMPSEQEVEEARQRATKLKENSLKLLGIAQSTGGLFDRLIWNIRHRVDFENVYSIVTEATFNDPLVLVSMLFPHACAAKDINDSMEFTNHAKEWLEDYLTNVVHLQSKHTHEKRAELREAVQIGIDELQVNIAYPRMDQDLSTEMFHADMSENSKTMHDWIVSKGGRILVVPIAAAATVCVGVLDMTISDAAVEALLMTDLRIVLDRRGWAGLTPGIPPEMEQHPHSLTLGLQFLGMRHLPPFKVSDLPEVMSGDVLQGKSNDPEETASCR